VFWTKPVPIVCAVAGADHTAMASRVLLSTSKSLGQPSIWIGLAGPEGTSRQDTQVKHQQIPLTPRVRVFERPPSSSPNPPAYWPMEPSDPATSPRGRRETLAPSTVGAFAPTRLCRGGQSSHHRVRGREEKGSLLPKKRTKGIPSRSYRCLIPHRGRHQDTRL
jgi:hypothetical protein